MGKKAEMFCVIRADRRVPHTPCMYALHSPSLKKVTHRSFPVVKGELDSGRVSVRGKGGRDRERREGKRRAFYDT